MVPLRLNGAFALLLLLPVLDLAFQIDPVTPPIEKRLLATCPPAPAASRAGLKVYFAGWETYFNDHFGCRIKADQFVAYMQAHSTVEVLDLRPVLLAAKSVTPIYLKTDTHWNKLGAFIACDAIVEKLAQNGLPGLVPLTTNDFTLTPCLEPGGDLVNLRGIRITMAESNALVLAPKPALPELSIFIPQGQHVMDQATASNPLGHGLALVQTDSFGRAWIPFLGYHFHETDFFWQYHLNGPVIEQRKPAVVINEMLERFFNVADPNELAAQDRLP